MICKDMIYVEPREVNVTVVATHEELEVGAGKGLSLFLPLQRTGICASLFLIIKHGLGLRVHRRNTLSSHVIIHFYDYVLELTDVVLT